MSSHNSVNKINFKTVSRVSILKAFQEKNLTWCINDDKMQYNHLFETQVSHSITTTLQCHVGSQFYMRLTKTKHDGLLSQNKLTWYTKKSNEMICLSLWLPNSLLPHCRATLGHSTSDSTSHTRVQPKQNLKTFQVRIIHEHRWKYREIIVWGSG